MTKSIKFNLIKLFTLVLAICAGVAIAVLPGGNSNVSAEEANPAFNMVDDIRIDTENDLSGIKFTSTVNGAWLTANPGAKYTFGTLVFPSAKLSDFDMEGTDIDAIKNGVDGIKFVAVSDRAVTEGFSYSHSLVFNSEEISSFAGVTEDNVDAVLDGFYAKEFAAVSFAIVDGTLVWGDDALLSSMVKVATEALADPALAESAKAFIPGSVQAYPQKSYISKEDGVLVIPNGSYNANYFAKIMINGEYLIPADDYTVDGDTLVISENALNAVESGYYDVFVTDPTGNILVVDCLIADKALDTAEEIKETFDYGDATFGQTYAEHAGVYVLAKDVDMTGVTINNRVAPNKNITKYVQDGDVYVAGDKYVSGDIGFNGIFDGMGYSISNATVNMASYMPSYTKNETGGTGWLNEPGYGFFHILKEDSQVRNVAFINLKGASVKTNNHGLTAPLAYSSAGIVENVYVDINVDTVISRGPIAAFTSTAKVNNYVVNFPRAVGYDFVTEINNQAAETNTYAKSLYAYGYGSFMGGGGGNAPSFDATYGNIMVVSPMPLYVFRGTGDMSSTTAIVYGENETELHYDFDGELTGTVQDAVAAESTKVKVLAGARRYDSFTAVAADESFAKKFTDTGLFKVANGQFLWHSQTATVVVDSAVDFDAAEGVLKTSVLDGQTIVSATVNGSEVAYTEGKFVGVPELNNLSDTQNFSMVVNTEDAIYTFSNVSYWGSVIENQTELKAALDYDYSTSDKNNLGFYKLANNIDIDKATWTVIDYSDLKASTTWNGLSCGAGFAGIFDGCGYTIDFNGTGAGEFGIFGAIATAVSVDLKQPATVKNLAIIEYSQNWKPVLAQFGTNHTNNKGALIENLYVTWLNTAVQSGLIYEPSNEGTIIRNVVVNIENNVSYGKNIAEGSYENISPGCYGGTLYHSLRRGSVNVANITDNFVSIGKGALVKNVGKMATTTYEMWFKTTGDATNGYVHTLKNGGWANGTDTVVCSPELYFGYASNMEYGDTTINRGMKAGFAAIASKYANGAAIAGYYCAECGEVFSLEAGNCTTCVDEADTPVALTQSANLWRESISYNWEFTKCSEVDNAAVAATGEMVFANTYKYASSSAMAAAYNADNTLFASFVGDAGNGLWAVNEGVLTWVGVQA